MQTVTKSKEEQSSGKKSTASSTFFYFRVSQLAHFAMCAKRSKLELFNQVYKVPVGSKSIVRGNRMHKIYNTPYKSFNRQYLLYKLIQLNKYMVFERQVDNIVVRGSFDDVNVTYKDGKQAVSLVEVKTTGKPRLWSPELKCAIRQLQLYIWLMKPVLEKLGYVLSSVHSLEVYSQNSGALLKKIDVYEDLEMETWIRMVVKSFQGLERVTIPERWVCKVCPRQVREACNWYERC